MCCTPTLVPANARKLDEIMPYFAADADWPNGMTGSRELGHEAIEPTGRISGP